MKKMKRPLLINAGIAMLLILLDLLLGGSSSSGGYSMPRLFTSGTLILLLAPVNFLVGMIRNRNQTGDGQYYFLLSGVLLLIGFSVCSLS
ncbi:MAG: hypothetical protein EOO14_26675 [Chitinophagaceae bacterium]|nr:MAG: hypothetical protein EOO14_26675 [Chitinophagaceae bacterium]